MYVTQICHSRILYSFSNSTSSDREQQIWSPPIFSLSCCNFVSSFLPPAFFHLSEPAERALLHSYIDNLCRCYSFSNFHILDAGCSLNTEHALQFFFPSYSFLRTQIIVLESVLRYELPFESPGECLRERHVKCF